MTPPKAKSQIHLLEEMVRLTRATPDPWTRVSAAGELADAMTRLAADLYDIRGETFLELMADRWSQTAIADRLGMTRSNVNRLVTRARKRNSS